MTETPACCRAIDRAATRWPGEPRSKLLWRLVDVGGETLERRDQFDVEAHRAAVVASSGASGAACRAALVGESTRIRESRRGALGPAHELEARQMNTNSQYFLHSTKAAV